MTKEIDWTQLDEMGLREAEAPHPKTVEELAAVIKALTERDNDYGTCVYAMSIVATAAFNYVANQVGVSGFQASCADLDILRRTRRIAGPFMLVDLNDTLYPQYDVQAKVAEYIAKNRDWQREEARKLLAKHALGDNVHPDVLAHWRKLAE